MAELTISINLDGSRVKSQSKSVQSEISKIGDEALKTTKRTESLAKVDHSGLIGRLRQVGEQIKNIGSAVGSSLSQLGSFFGNFVGNLASNAVSFLTSTIIEGGKALLDYSARMEQTSISFGVMLKSGEKAKILLADLNKFAADTPFEFPEIAQASKSLLAFGVAQEKIIPTLKNIGDIASGIGIPLTELAEIYGKAKVQGRLFAEDINQLTGRGIPIISELSKQFGVSESKVKDLVEQGKVGFPQLEKAFQDLTSTGGQFSGMMQAQSRTFDGALSTIKDTLTQAGATAFEPFFNAIRNFTVDFATNLQAQETQTKGVSFAFGKSIGESVKKGYNAGFSGVSSKDLLEFGNSVLTEGFFTTITKPFSSGFLDGFNKDTNLSIADLRKLDDTIGQVKDSVKTVPPLSNQLDAEKAKKQAESLKNILDNLNDSVAFFGQETSVAATKQQLINAGIYEFNSEGAKTALVMAGVLDKLKAAQEATGNYNKELGSTRDELQKLRENASFEINFPNNTELDKFDNFVKKQAGNFKELHSEIELTRHALQSAAVISDVRKTIKINSDELKRVSNEITNILNPDTSKLDSALREISNNLGFKGIRLFDNSNIDGTDSIFSAQIQSFIKQYKDAIAEFDKIGDTASFNKLEAVEANWKEFLLSFKIDSDRSIIGDKTEVQEWIDLFPKLADAIQKVSDTARDNTFKGAISDLDNEILELNVKLGLSTELSKADAVAKLLQTEAYKNLTPEMREAIQAKAAEIDELQKSVKAQQDYQNVFKKTTDIFENALTKLAKGDWKGFLNGMFEELKRFLIRATAELLASKFLKILTGQGQSSNSSSGGIGGFLKSILGIGSTSGASSTPPFNPSSSSGSNGNFGLSNSNSSNNPVIQTLGGLVREDGSPVQTGANKNFTSAIFGEKGFGANAGTVGGLAAIATLVSGFIPGKAGSVIGSTASGLLTGIQLGSMIAPGIGTIVGGAIGAIAGFFSSIFGSKKRKVDKNENLPKLQQGFTEAFDQLRQLSADKNAFFNDPEGTLEKAKALRQQIASGFNVKFESKKYKKIAEQQISQKLAEANRIISDMESTRDQAVAAREIDRQLNANFATGVYMDAAFLKQYSKFKRRNGMLDGQFTGRDILPSYLAEGEMVLNPLQIGNVIQNADGQDVFKGAGIPGYATGTFVGGNDRPTQSSFTASSSSSKEKQSILVTIYQTNSGFVESDVLDIVVEGLQDDYELQTEVVKTYDKTKARVK